MAANSSKYSLHIMVPASHRPPLLHWCQVFPTASRYLTSTPTCTPVSNHIIRPDPDVPLSRP